jgi:HEAT repeat protein
MDKKESNLPPRRSYKTDESFLEKIAIGAIGTQRVYENLRQQGHTPIELERGSMSFKIWKAIKIKRIRVPDILCTACGRRVESRAKTKFEISMSHSLSDPQRGWDFGLEDNDYIAIVVCHRVGERPIDWQAENLVQYVSIKDMRQAHKDGVANIVEAKGAQEGFEARISWGACVASADGTVTRLTEDRIQYRRSLDSRTITYQLSRRGRLLPVLVSEGASVVANQVIAAVVPVTQSYLCPQTSTGQEYVRRLISPSLSDRYGAAKALSYFAAPETTEPLAQRVADTREHIYVRLEAAASLSRLNDQRGVGFIAQCLNDDYLENRLEAVIILGEIRRPVATRLLIETLGNDDQHPEIRAGAAWALGEIRDRSSLNALIGKFCCS